MKRRLAVLTKPAGAEIVIALAGEIGPQARAALVAAVPEDASHRFEVVRNSLAVLQELHNRLIADSAELEAGGIDINAVITDESGNIVQVGVAGDVSAAQAMLEERYGSGLITTFPSGGGVTTHQGCYDRKHCYGPPVKAGISVAPPGHGYATTADICSLAFTVNQSGVRRILTAGHNPCADQPGDFYHDGFKIGSRRTRSFFDGETTEHADAATIGNLTSTQDTNRLYHCSPTCYITIIAAQGSDNDNIPVCLSAQMTPLIRCGTMINKNASIQFSEGWLVAQREATYAIYFGDSGGAAFSQTGTAYGVQSSCLDHTGNKKCEEGDTADNALYSHIQNVFSELGGSMSIYTGS